MSKVSVVKVKKRPQRQAVVVAACECIDPSRISQAGDWYRGAWDSLQHQAHQPRIGAGAQTLYLNLSTYLCYAGLVCATDARGIQMGWKL